VIVGDLVRRVPISKEHTDIVNKFGDGVIIDVESDSWFDDATFYKVIWMGFPGWSGWYDEHEIDLISTNE
jgi:hypothetical protein|tara:strand:- start:668 stop:877 length:210 start_codon:yes stop_codon:yes gene_type:complete